MNPALAVLLIFAALLLVSNFLGRAIAHYLAGHAPLRDEDEELLHPLGRTRLP